MSRTNYILWITLLLFSLLSNGCGYKKEIKTIKELCEDNTRRINTYIAGNPSDEIKVDSLATAINNLNSRLDNIMPANYQWMKLQKGSTIKWYLNEEAQNVYIQFLDFKEETREIDISVSTRARTTRNILRPGDAIEHIWEMVSPPKSFIIIFHRLRFVDDGSIYALFSISYKPTE